ncbi:MAG: serine hydrolase [Chloroflexota bacterium]|nr:serine hydrolase [Chloroflexota bacterium]
MAMTDNLLQAQADLATAIDILDKWTAHNLREKHLPGLALGLVYGGELLWGKGYGVANLETGQPVTLDTRFRIASISKTFTATGILQLRDAGKLRLDDPVSQYLDWFDLRYRDAPEITIRNLLTHTSGLPRDSVNAMWTDCAAPDWEEFIAQTRSRQPTRAPYENYAYSNLGYSLLGGIIAAVSGGSWADYLRQNVLAPLGMTETYPVPDAEDAQLATGYTREKDDGKRDAFPFWKMNAFEASANFASSVNDLVKYAAFHLGLRGDAVLSSYTLYDMHRVHWLEESWKGGYGLGMGLHKIDDWVISGHGGGYPGYLTAFTLCREHKTGVIALSNSLGSNPHQIAERAYKLVLPELIKASAEPTQEANLAWGKYVGDYASEWALQKVVIRDGQLQLLTLDDLDGKPTLLDPTDDEMVFVLRQAGQSNETLRFELDAEGDVVRMWERNEYSTRIN